MPRADLDIGVRRLGEIFERVLPEKSLDWTGERLTTATAGQVEIEHLHRYFLARDLCRDLDVLDVASGEGYGTALLGQVARSVVGVEISSTAVAHATESYRGPRIRFVQGDARRLPIEAASVDAVVSFETIEHFYEHDQFLTEVRRVLRPGGRLIVSSPDRDIYSPAGSDANPYHVRELSRAELCSLLDRSFGCVRLLSQRPILGSALIADGDGSERQLTFERRGARHFEVSSGLPRSVYIVAVASDREIHDLPNSLYIEAADVGAVLGAAAAAKDAAQALASRTSAFDAALVEAHTGISAVQTELAAARCQLDSICQQRDTAYSERDMAYSERDAAYSERDAAYSERDAARTRSDIARLARRAASASEGHWRGKLTQSEQRAADLERRSDAAERRACDWERRASDAERMAAEWQARYEQLRTRLESILQRFWIRRAARLIPAPTRRLLRARLLGSPHP